MLFLQLFMPLYYMLIKCTFVFVLGGDTGVLSLMKIFLAHYVLPIYLPVICFHVYHKLYYGFERFA